MANRTSPAEFAAARQAFAAIAQYVLVPSMAVAVDPNLLDALVRAERNTLWLLVAAGIANVVLAVWRPRLTVKVR